MDPQTFSHGIYKLQLGDKRNKPFVNMLNGYLMHIIQPIGTVGKYSAAPINSAELMRQNIPYGGYNRYCRNSPLYSERHQNNQTVSGISEMLHVESGIAYAFNKPMWFFCSEGAVVGNFLPNITQYIVLGVELQGGF